MQPAIPAAASGFSLAVAAHFVHAGQVGGAEHMLYNLLRGIWGQGVGLTVICSNAARLAPGFRQEMSARGGQVRLVEAGGPGPRFIAEQRAVLTAGLDADAILFPNYYVPPVVPKRLGRVVCVLHDMQYRHFSMNFSRRKRAWLRFAHALAIRRCERLLVISDFVRQDAIRFLGPQFQDKVMVVPNAICWDRFGGIERMPSATPRILSVAAQYDHKNLATLIRAFAQIARRHPHARLVLCGQDYNSLRGVAGSRGSLKDLASSLGVTEQVELTGYIDDTALGCEYRSATMFAFPSVFEGFGMPPVEALGFGLPTLTTRCTALPETTRGLAQYVDNPHSVGEWAERIEAMLDRPADYGPSPEVAVELRAFYAPGRIAAEYVEACQRAAIGSGRARPGWPVHAVQGQAQDRADVRI